jgi:hypothetical protein
MARLLGETTGAVEEQGIVGEGDFRRLSGHSMGGGVAGGAAGAHQGSSRAQKKK